MAGNAPYSVAVDPFGKFVYVANQVSNSISAYTINAATGALTAVNGSPFPAGSAPWSLTDPSGKFAYVANASSSDISVYAIDASNGALTAVSGSPFAAGSLPYAVAVGH
jgi:YVTN family beta-propeller protein